MPFMHTQEIELGRASNIGLCAMVFMTAALLLVFILAGPALSAPKAVYKIPKAAKPPPEANKSGSGAGKSAPGVKETKAPVKPKYVYNPKGKPDPFKPFIAEQEELDEARRKEPRTYLETLELSQLELIAIIESPKGNWAMVRDGKGIGYSIRKGTAIGTRDGVVAEINGKEIVVKERHRDLKGKTKVKYVRKGLHVTQ